MLTSITKFIVILIGLERNFNFLLSILTVSRSKRYNRCNFVLLRLAERVICITLHDALLRLLMVYILLAI
jgi:hypothetical protein